MCNGEWKHIPKLWDYCGKAEGRVNWLVKTDKGSLNSLFRFVYLKKKNFLVRYRWLLYSWNLFADLKLDALAHTVHAYIYTRTHTLWKAHLNRKVLTLVLNSDSLKDSLFWKKERSTWERSRGAIKAAFSSLEAA